MDDRTAYEILKIKAGTSLNDIAKRHDHFSRLYKHYQMGESVYISPERLEQMKAAYESLLYKRISDEELQFLYPFENNSRCYQTYDKILLPLMQRHKAKIIYTLVMCVLTIIIISIMNYTPVDFQISVYSQPSQSLYEFEMRRMCLDAYQYELVENLPGLKKPRVEYQSYYPPDDLQSGVLGLYAADTVDVYIMEETLLRELEKKDIDFYRTEDNVPEVYISKETNLYKYICDTKSENKSWVAVISPLSDRKKQALNFLRLVSGSDFE